MIKPPSSPVGRASDPPSSLRFDHRLAVVVLVLVIIVAAGLLVRSMDAIPQPNADPSGYLVGP